VACAPPDTVAIVGLDGYAVQKAHFAPLTSPWAECAEPLLAPQAYVASDRVFYADGRGVVRSLAPDGETATVANFPVGDQQELSFAVRPDGQEVLAAILTLPQRPSSGASCPTGFGPGDWILDLYRATAGGASNRISHQVVAQGPVAFEPLQFVGWDAISPLATHPTQISGGGSQIERWFGPVVRIDRASGAVTRQLGPCTTDVIADGSSVCPAPTGITVFAPDGSKLWALNKPQQGAPPPDGPSPGYAQALLAPDRQHVAADGPMLATPELIASDGKDVAIGAANNQFGPLGWLDSSSVMGWIGPAEEMARVRIDAPSKVVDMGFQGTYVGALPPVT
jgi:hypothetical protein